MNQSTEETSYSDGQIIWTYIFLSVVLLLIILNNGVILTAVLSQRRLQSQINIVILGSLALAQLLGGLLSIPSSAALLQHKSDNILKFSHVVITFCGVSSQLHLMILCVDRCFALLDSMLYGILKRGNVVAAVIVTWSLSIIASVLSILDFKYYSVFIVTTFFVVPSLIDVLGYSLIYRTSSRIVKQNEITTLWRKELRLAKSFAILTLLLTLCWLPYLISSLLHDHCTSCDTTNSHLVLFVLHCQLLSLTFSSVVYYNGSLDFRLAFKKLAKELCNFARERNGHQDDIPHGSPSPPQNNDREKKSSKRGEAVSQVNLAMFFDDGERESAQSEVTARLRQSLPQSATHNDQSITAKDEIHVVPFDQARFFDEKEHEEELQSGNETMETLEFSIHSLEEDAIKELEESIAFHDIELIPYEQSC